MNWETIWKQSRIVAGLQRVDSWLARQVRMSRTYRWLTAESGSAVVVIDLRKTATIGNMLALCTWLASEINLPGGTRLGPLPQRNLRLTHHPKVVAAIETSKSAALVRRLSGIIGTSDE